MNGSEKFPLQGINPRIIDRQEIPTGPIENFKISPAIMIAKIIKDDYYFTFNNMISTGIIQRGMPVVNQNILGKKLQDWVRESDKHYIKLVDYSTNKSTFCFDIDKWIDDGLKNVKPYDDWTSLSRRYRLSKPLPYMVRVYGLSMTYDKFIADRFKKTMKQNQKLRKSVFSMIESITSKTLGIDSIDIFEYRYDNVSNSVVASVKPIYLTTIFAAAALYQQKLEKQKSKPIDFDKRVLAFLKR